MHSHRISTLMCLLKAVIDCSSWSQRDYRDNCFIDRHGTQTRGWSTGRAAYYPLVALCTTAGRPSLSARLWRWLHCTIALL